MKGVIKGSNLHIADISAGSFYDRANAYGPVNMAVPDPSHVMQAGYLMCEPGRPGFMGGAVPLNLAVRVIPSLVRWPRLLYPCAKSCASYGLQAHQIIGLERLPQRSVLVIYPPRTLS